MPTDQFIREKFTKERSAARKLAREYFERYPKDRYQTEVGLGSRSRAEERNGDSLIESAYFLSELARVATLVTLVKLEIIAIIHL
jgi:hypothetical protein